MKVARFDPDKRWLWAIDAIAFMRDTGARPRLLMRGSRSPYGDIVGARIRARGLTIDRIALPTTGTYTVYVDPQGSATGSLNLQLNTVPADASAGSVTINGAAVGFTNTTPGQNVTGTFVTSYKIHPFVGVIDPGHAWTPQPTEVEEVLELSLPDLVTGFEMKRLVRRGVPIKTPAYTVNGHFIWGATARIVQHLLERLEPLVAGAAD